MVNQIIPCLIELIQLCYRLMTLLQGQLLTCISMARSQPLLRPFLRFQRRPASSGPSLAHLRLFSVSYGVDESAFITTPEWRRQSLKGEAKRPKSLYPRFIGERVLEDYATLEALFGHLQPRATGENPFEVHGMPYIISGIFCSSYSQEECWPKGH